MKKHEFSEENVVLESEVIEAVEEQPVEPKPVEKPKKLAKKMAKVIGYNAKRNVIVYEFEGKTFQSNCKEYDGVSEYIEI